MIVPGTVVDAGELIMVVAAREHNRGPSLRSYVTVMVRAGAHPLPTIVQDFMWDSARCVVGP